MKQGLKLKKYLLEIKIGVFLIVAFLILFVASLSIREVNFLRGSYVIKVKFKFAEGLKPASPVRFCGVDVGEVKKVEVKLIDSQPIVFVYAKIRKGVNIPIGSRFFINSLSLFGEKYLEITPPKDISGFIKDNQEVWGMTGTPLFSIINSFRRTMESLDEFVRDAEVKKSFKEIVINAKKITEELDTILTDIKNKEGTLGRFIYDDSIYRKTEELIDDLKANPWKLLHKPRKKKTKKKK